MVQAGKRMETRQPKRGRYQPSSDKSLAHPTSLHREAQQSFQQIYRLGTSLPPLVQGPLQGELQLYVPFVNFRRGKGGWQEPPKAVEVGVG